MVYPTKYKSNSLNDVELLFEAIEYNNVEKVKQLLDSGLNVDVKDNDNMTSLQKASAKGYTDIVELLIERHADVNEQDYKGWTPLHYAAYNAKSNCIKILLKAGADNTIKNNIGITPLHWGCF